MAITLAKPISFKPALGLLDLRSDPAEITAGHRRIILNHRLQEQGRECRSGGWVKLFSDNEVDPFKQGDDSEFEQGDGSGLKQGYSAGFLNQDLHDQLLNLQLFYDYIGPEYTDDGCDYDTQARIGCREAVTFGFEFVSENATRKLIVGTNQRLYELAERWGNWRILADGLGNPTRNENEEECAPCLGHRFRGAQLLGYMVVTNGYNVPMSYKYGAAAEGCDLWSANPIPDLVLLNVASAGVITQFKGLILLADIDADGVRQPGLIMHSDFNNPLEFVPLPGINLARTINVGFGERILALEQMGDYLMCYTDKAIHRGQAAVQFSGDVPAQLINFTRVYEGPNCLKYRYSMVNTGTEHLWGALDGIYVLRSPFSAPERIEWIHRASGAIYKGTAEWASELTEMPAGIDVEFGPLNREACDNFIGGYNPETKEIWFSWPTDDNVCANWSLRMNIQTGYEHASLVDHGFSMFMFYRSDTRPTYREWLLELGVCDSTAFPLIKEGEGLLDNVVNPPPYIWNAEENPFGTIEPDSLCALLGETTLEDICAACDANPVFIGASTTDFTLKEFREDVYYRERWDGAAYQQDGYASFVQTMISDVFSDVEKILSAINIEFRAESQVEPSLLYAQAGTGAQAGCLTWMDIGSRPLKCLTDFTHAEHAANNTRPDLTARYPTYWRALYLAFRYYVTGTGGASCYDRTTAYLRNAQTRA